MTDPHESESPPPMPRWVKAFGVAFAILLIGSAVMVVHGIITGTGPFQHQPVPH